MRQQYMVNSQFTPVSFVDRGKRHKGGIPVALKQKSEKLKKRKCIISLNPQREQSYPHIHTMKHIFF